MRLTYLLAAASSLALTLASSLNPRAVSPNIGSDLAKRGVYANACATITVRTPTTIAALCTADPNNALCNPLLTNAQSTLDGLVGLNGGNLLVKGNVLDTSTLTASSNQVLRTRIPATLRTGLGDVDPSVTHVLAIISYLAPGLISSQTDSCSYPADHYTPTCTKSCSFVCETGYKVCNLACIPSTQDCPSTAVVPPNYGRRSLAEGAACARGYSACPVPGLYKAGLYECLDTSTNVESCGGCMTPFPGNAAGVDCSTIAGAEEVDCVKGLCKVVSCEPGYSLVGNDCEPDESGTDGAVTSQRVLGRGKRGTTNVFKKRQQNERRVARRAVIARSTRKESA